MNKPSAPTAGPQQPPHGRDPQALIVALRSRRFVIVHDDRPTRLRSTERLCKPIRELRAGERVYYQGREETVHTVARY